MNFQQPLAGDSERRDHAVYIEIAWDTAVPARKIPARRHLNKFEFNY